MSETATERGPRILDADAHDRESAGSAVAALYRFSALPDCEERRAPLQELCEALGVTGTLLLASEGINGTIAGRRAALDAVVATLRGWPGFGELDVKWSAATDNPFLRLKVRLKREIVTMGVPDIDPTRTVGTYVEPDDWNELIARDDVVLVDTRNDYEVAIGTFDGAIDPKTASFREFPGWVDANLDPKQNTAVAMFCTGGIRCEKATALLKERGFDRVYHLKGGILRYLETVPPEQSQWHGECFVFDRRVSVGHGLTEGHYQLCSVCRRPIAAADGRSGGFAAKDCPECRAGAQPETLARADERRRQIRLARQRGNTHLGRKRET